MADTMTAGGKKERVSKRVFIGAGGEEETRVMLDVTSMRLELLETGETLDMDLGELPGFNSLPKGTARAAAAWGIMTNVTNAFGGASDSEMYELAERRWEAIRGGQWSVEREKGPRIEDFVQATGRFLRDRGTKVDDAVLASVREGVLAQIQKNKDYVAAQFKAYPELEAHVLSIKNERAEVRRKAILAKSTSTPADAAKLLASLKV